MATRAVYTCAGFPRQPLNHLRLHHNGYPTGAACSKDQRSAPQHLQAIGAFEPLAVVAVAPGFAVARHQTLLPLQPRNPAGRLPLRTRLWFHQPDLADAALGVAEHHIPAQGNQVMDAGLKTLQVEASIPSLH